MNVCMYGSMEVCMYTSYEYVMDLIDRAMTAVYSWGYGADGQTGAMYVCMYVCMYVSTC